MGTLFNLPKREEKDIFSIIKKSQEYIKPKISIRGTSLQDRIKLIEQNITQHGGLLLDTFEKSVNYLDELSLCEYIGEMPEWSNGTGIVTGKQRYLS